MSARKGEDSEVHHDGGGPMRTLIKGGTIVNADASTVADVLIDGERIALIGQELENNADRTVDASGKWVIPGAIDVHTHMELPFGGTFAKDTFETGTRAAAFGGTTTTIDYGFHMIMSDVTDATLAEMDALVDEGVTDFKLFTAYPGVFFSDDGAIFRAMQQTASNGGLILMHAENGLAIDVVAAQNAEAGNTDPYYHGVSRSPVMEGEATNRVIRLAQVAGVPVYIVHLSATHALDEVRRARDEGLPTYAETCPQYLFLTLEDLGNGFEGAKFVCSPPLRPAEHAPELWKGLAKDDLQVVSTDHCPFDFHGQKDLGRGDFRKVPNGLPGVEDRVNLLHSGGVAKGHLTPNRWVDVISTAPARMFGLEGRKGVVAVGADADLVIYDPSASHTISAKTRHMDVDYSTYEGWEVTGRADTVLSRGKVIVDGDEWLGAAGDGGFLKREPTGELLARA